MNPVKDVLVTSVALLGAVLLLDVPIMVLTPSYTPLCVAFAAFLAIWIAARRFEIKRRRARVGTFERHQLTMLTHCLDVVSVLMWVLALVFGIRARVDLSMWLGISTSIYQVYVSVRSLLDDDGFCTDARRTVTSWFTVSRPATTGAS